MYNKRLGIFKNKYPELKDDMPSFSQPTDSMGIMSMFIKASAERILYELPRDCLAIIRGTWSEKKINELVDRIVWPEASIVAISHPIVAQKLNNGELNWTGRSDREKKYPKPKLIIENNFKLRHPVSIYPLAYIALCSAYQHSYLLTLRSNGKYLGFVKIKYKSSNEKTETILIENNGLESTAEIQEGWMRDVQIFKGLTGNWTIVEIEKGVFSKFNEEKKIWTTIIEYKKKDKKS